jgi:peptidoglycan hydrolase-like protein with peptidoglycan-binding domain
MPVTSQLPASGAGYDGYAAPANQWAEGGVIRALYEVAAGWAEGHPEGPRIGIGDLSQRGGGAMPGHVSHRDGFDCDLRPVRNDGREAPVTIRMKAYSRGLTQELVDRLWGNSQLAVATILFNDRAIAGVKKFPGHDNHLHVRFGVGWNALEEGDRGPAVQQVQRRLNTWASAAPLRVDGHYGPSTRARVRAFQAVRGLAQDGVVGPITWRELRLLRPWEAG